VQKKLKFRVRVRIIVRVMLEDSIQSIAFKNTRSITCSIVAYTRASNLGLVVSEARRPVVSRM